MPLQPRSQTPVALSGMLASVLLSRPSSPEALGSPQGYVVPAALRLLRPHPPLWIQRPPYLLRPAVIALRPCMGWYPELPHFTLRVCPCVPPSVPRRSGWLLVTVTSPSTLAFTNSIMARLPLSHAVGSRVGRVTRLQSSLYAAARRLARPSPTRTFTFELSPPKSPSRGVEYNYMGTQSIPMTGLQPARHTALWAANGNTRK